MINVFGCFKNDCSVEPREKIIKIKDFENVNEGVLQFLRNASLEGA